MILKYSRFTRFRFKVQGSGRTGSRCETSGSSSEFEIWVDVWLKSPLKIYLRSRGVAPLFILVLAYIRVTMIRNTILPRIRRKFPCFHGYFHYFHNSPSLSIVFFQYLPLSSSVFFRFLYFVRLQMPVHYSDRQTQTRRLRVEHVAAPYIMEPPSEQE